MSIREPVCAMCEQASATTTWGLPVCQDCADGLTTLDGELKAMEAEDPTLAELGRRVDVAGSPFERKEP